MHVPGVGFICFPLMLIWVVVSMDLHVAQFFFPHGFVCPCLLPKAMLLVLTNRLRRLLPGLLINWKKLSFLDFSTWMQPIFLGFIRPWKLLVFFKSSSYFLTVVVMSLSVPYVDTTLMGRISAFKGSIFALGLISRFLFESVTDVIHHF